MWAILLKIKNICQLFGHHSEHVAHWIKYFSQHINIFTCLYIIVVQCICKFSEFMLQTEPKKKTLSFSLSITGTLFQMTKSTPVFRRRITLLKLVIQICVLRFWKRHNLSYPSIPHTLCFTKPCRPRYPYPIDHWCFNVKYVINYFQL